METIRGWIRAWKRDQERMQEQWKARSLQRLDLLARRLGLQRCDVQAGSLPERFPAFRLFTAGDFDIGRGTILGGAVMEGTSVNGQVILFESTVFFTREHR